jgi:hypothetical protein
MSENFTIYVMGDAREDVFTCAEEGNRPVGPTHRDVAADAAYDAFVTSGAPFIAQMLETLFDKHSVKRLSQVIPRPANGGKGASLDLLPPVLTHLRRFDKTSSKGRPAHRIARFEKLVKPSDNARVNCFARPRQSPSGNGRRVLIAHHGGSSWDDDHASHVTGMIETMLNNKDQERLRIIVNLKDIPEVYFEKGNRVPKFKENGFLQHLYSSFKQQVGVVVSLSALRRQGAAISYGLSWEQTVEDFSAELHLFPQLRALSQFRDLFVRVEMEGVFHVENAGEDNGRDLAGRLHFVPYAPDGIRRDPDLDGRIVGKNTVLIASLAYQMANAPDSASEDEISKRISAGIASAIYATIMAYDEGYDTKFVSAAQRAGDELLQAWMDFAVKHIKMRRDRNVRPVIAEHSIPQYLMSTLAPKEHRSAHAWRMLDDVLKNSPFHRVNVAAAVVKAGLDNVLNLYWADPDKKCTPTEKEIWQTLTRPEIFNPQDLSFDYSTGRDGDSLAMPPEPWQNLPEINGHRRDDGDSLFVPIAEFGALTVAEREEIEGLSSIRNLLSLYVRESKHNDRPISIAVFGPPGTGKSFAVKQIAGMIEPSKIEILEYNVAQFHSPEDLGIALTKVASVNNQGKIPVVFFDEFDCALSDKALGWLKFFLAPMQDGNFYGARQTIQLGRAVFVFAGGTHTSFQNFDPSSDPTVEKTNRETVDEQTEKIRRFIEQKGPDFISRLRGHINILPVNAEPGEGKHLMRRAIVLRSLLKRYGFTRPLSEAAMVHDAVIYALLTINKYRHGVRSMEQIVQMCAPINGDITCGSLPSRAQLNMHVDAEEFFIRLYRGRSRLCERREPAGDRRETPEQPVAVAAE